MAKYEMVLKRERTEWLETVEASSRRDAVARVMTRLGRRALNTEVVRIETVPEPKPLREIPLHIRRAMGEPTEVAS